MAPLSTIRISHKDRWWLSPGQVRSGFGDILIDDFGGEVGTFFGQISVSFWSSGSRMEAPSGSSPIWIRERPNRRFWSRSGQLFGTDFGLGLEPAGRNLEPHESECGRNFSGPYP